LTNHKYIYNIRAGNIECQNIKKKDYQLDKNEKQTIHVISSIRNTDKLPILLD
jgi:hypothetical protein